MKRILSVLLLCSISILPLSATLTENCDTSGYDSRITREHIDFVNQAARLIEENGTAALSDFHSQTGKWGRNVIVFDQDMKRLFYPGHPELEGENTIGQTDISGRPYFKWIGEIGEQKGISCGWVHYQTGSANGKPPAWQSVFYRKAQDRQGHIYLVGKNPDAVPMERNFIRDLVNSAANILQTRTEADALGIFRNTTSRFMFRDSYIFIFDGTGNCLIHMTRPDLERKNILNHKDSTGRYILKDIINNKNDSGWTTFYWPKPGGTKEYLKVGYFKKMTANGKTYIIGSSYFK